MSYMDRLIRWSYSDQSNVLMHKALWYTNATDSDRLLDVGCGIGRLVAHARNFDMLAYGIDVSQECIDRACQMWNPRWFCQFNGEDLPYLDHSFDIVTMLAVLAHVEKPVRLLMEIRRVLAPRGRLVIATPNIWFDRLMAPKNWITGYKTDPTIRRTYSAATLRQLLEALGFRVTVVEYEGERVHWFGRLLPNSTRAQVLVVAEVEGPRFTARPD